MVIKHKGRFLNLGEINTHKKRANLKEEVPIKSYTVTSKGVVEGLIILPLPEVHFLTLNGGHYVY